MKTSDEGPTQAVMMRAARDPQTEPDMLLGCVGKTTSLDRLLARHPNAPAQLLEQLSHSSDKATRKWVAIHPAASTQVLLKLAPQFPGDFFKNPVFDWLLLENPNLMVEIGRGVLKNILKRADCPASFMAWAAAHGSEEERLALAMNPQASASVLHEVERRGGRAATAAVEHKNHPAVGADVDLESAFRQAVASEIAEKMSHRSMPTFAQWPALSPYSRFKAFFDNSTRNYGLYYKRMKHESDLLRKCACHALAKGLLDPLYTDLSKRDFEVWTTSRGTDLSKHGFDVWRSGLESARGNFLCRYPDIAKNPLTPPAILIALASNRSDELRFDIASNPSTPAAALMVLAGDRSGGVRLCVAENAATPTAAFMLLARDTEREVRRAVARNTATPAAPLMALAGDTDWQIVFEVVSNPAAPAASLTVLADNSFLPIRSAVASNSATPATTLTALAGDLVIEVRKSVAGNSATPEAVLINLAADTSESVRRAVASNQATPSAALITLTGDSKKSVRRAVATNTATPAASLMALSGDSEFVVRGDVAMNPSTPAAALMALSGDSKFLVRGNVAENPSTPVATLIALAGDSKRPVRCAIARNRTTPADSLMALALDSQALVRCAVASNLSAPAATLIALADDSNWQVRRVVANNPATPAATLMGLADDRHYMVRRYVASNSAAPSETLAALKVANTDSFRRNVASDMATAVGTLVELASTSGTVDVNRPALRPALQRCLPKDIRRRVAGDFSTSEEMLSVLAGDPVVEVRKTVAGNPTTPEAVLTNLAFDPSESVRRAVALNPATPVAALRSLADDADEIVRWNAFDHPLTPADALLSLIKLSVEDIYKVAFEPSQSSWWLKAVAKLKILHERREIPTRWIAWPIALKMANPRRNRPQIQHASANLIRACEEGDILYLPENLVAKACRRQDLVLRLLGLASRHAEPTALAKRSRSTEWLERMAVARNANTPPNIIKILCDDPHRLVSGQAKATLMSQL